MDCGGGVNWLGGWPIVPAGGATNYDRKADKAARLLGRMSETTDGGDRQPDRKAPLGSVITGTLRPQDLVPAFAGALEQLDGARRYEQLVAECRSETLDADGIADLVDDLTDALGVFAPSYCYFGAHQGDGADFGFWPDWDAINADRRDGSLASGEELPEDGSRVGQYLHISDHGNTELYRWDARDRRWRSEWGIV